MPPPLGSRGGNSDPDHILYCTRARPHPATFYYKASKDNCGNKPVMKAWQFLNMLFEIAKGGCGQQTGLSRSAKLSSEWKQTVQYLIATKSKRQASYMSVYTVLPAQA